MFSKRQRVKELLGSDETGRQVIVMGWVRTFRNNQFIALNDGSTNSNLQVVAELGKFDENLLKRITTGASLKVTGELVASLGKGQKVEVKAESIEVLGDCDGPDHLRPPDLLPSAPHRPGRPGVRHAQVPDDEGQPRGVRPQPRPLGLRDARRRAGSLIADGRTATATATGTATCS